MILARGRYHGRRVEARGINGLILTETAYRPGDTIRRHRHAGAYFCCVIDGSFEERSGASTRRCHRSTVVYHPAEEPHSDRFGASGGRCLNVEIDPAWCLGEARASDLPETPVVLTPTVAAAVGHRLYREFRNTDDISTLAIEALTTLLVVETGRALRQGEHRPAWVDEAVELVRARFTESLKLDDIADALSVHPAHLSRAFSRHEGVSLYEMVRRLRVERASTLLSETTRSVASIAHGVGFFDHSHLTRTFRRYFGVTPSEYRRERQR